MKTNEKLIQVLKDMYGEDAVNEAIAQVQKEFDEKGEVRLGEGIRLVKSDENSEIYNCNHCGKLILSSVAPTKCPVCGLSDDILKVGKPNKLTIICKSAESPMSYDK
jgi:rubrerythrin